MKKLLITLLSIVTLNVQAKNDSLTAGKSYLSIEIDPTPFMFGGYSFSLKYSPAKLNKLSIMSSVYSSELPDNLLSKENYDNGFRDVKLNKSCAFFADYFLRNDRTGFHFGPSVFFYNKTVGFVEGNDKLNFKSVYPNVRLGYVFRPFANSGFYLNPWINLGKEIMLGEEKDLNGAEYKTTGLNYICAIHLGYRVAF